MVDYGPSLLPGSIPADSSHGHPLLFYFLGASWLSIFPDTIFFSHLFGFIYILILGFNFYTTRYILSLLPLYILTAVYFVFRALENSGSSNGPEVPD